MIFNLLGAIANLLFSIACISMAWKTWRSGRDIGTPLSTMWTFFFFANAMFGVYLFGTFGPHWLFANAVVETLCWKLALWYHYFPRDIYKQTARTILKRPTPWLPVGVCQREAGHPGPCNGIPKRNCPAWDETH